MAKTLFHSEAVRISPIRCRVKTDVQHSKYKGNPDYCVLDIEGEGERTYNIDNADCSNLLHSLKGCSCMLEFSGRDADARIRSLGAGQSQSPPPDTRQQRGGPHPEDDGHNEPPPDLREQPRRERTDAPRQPQNQAANEAADILKARHFQVQVANLRSIALDCAVWTVKRHNARHPEMPMAPSDVRELSSVGYITAERAGMVNLMPTTPLPDDAPKGGSR